MTSPRTSPADRRSSGASRFPAAGHQRVPSAETSDKGGTLAAHLIFPHAREYFVDPVG